MIICNNLLNKHIIFRFLSSPDYITVIFLMCKKMLIEADPGEDPQCHAAKLLEVIILQCKCQGHNINELIPSFIEVAFLRLSKEIKTSELRTMCIQVLSKGLELTRKAFSDIVVIKCNFCWLVEPLIGQEDGDFLSYFVCLIHFIYIFSILEYLYKVNIFLFYIYDLWYFIFI